MSATLPTPPTALGASSTEADTDGQEDSQAAPIWLQQTFPL